MTGYVVHRLPERAEQARKLAGSVLEHIKDAPDDAGVGAKVRVLRALCGHIVVLANEVAQCCGANCMGRRTDGFSFWVPQDRLALETARTRRLQDENERLRAALLAIVEESQSDDDWLDRLTAGPRAVEQRSRDLAVKALNSVEAESQDVKMPVEGQTKGRKS